MASRENVCIYDGTRGFCYDLENRLTRVTAAAPDPCTATPTMTLAYDPLGRLRQTVAGSTTTQFLYDGDRLVAEYNGSGALLRRYVHGAGVDEPILWYEGSGTSDRRYLVSDHQGSIIAEAGAATTRYSYGPYGEPNSWTGSRFRYTGQIALPEIQLYHYKARVYDPVLGRFLQTDPVSYRDDMNLYAYVRNDPLNNTDPTGRSCVQNEDRRGMTCRVDDPGNLTRREVRLIERAYTRAVNRLLQNPDRTRTVTVNGRSFTTRAGDRAQALATAMVRGGTRTDARATTAGGELARETSTGYPAEITIMRNATQRDLSGGTQNIERDIGKTFIHESLHLDPGEAVMRGNLIERLFFNMSDFNRDHQDAYKDAASELYDVPGLLGP